MFDALNKGNVILKVQFLKYNITTFILEWKLEYLKDNIKSLIFTAVFTKMNQNTFFSGLRIK